MDEGALSRVLPSRARHQGGTESTSHWARGRAVGTLASEGRPRGRTALEYLWVGEVYSLTWSLAFGIFFNQKERMSGKGLYLTHTASR